jgi:hypothetical protein
MHTWRVSMASQVVRPSKSGGSHDATSRITCFRLALRGLDKLRKWAAERDKCRLCRFEQAFRRDWIQREALAEASAPCVKAAMSITFRGRKACLLFQLIAAASLPPVVEARESTCRCGRAPSAGVMSVKSSSSHIFSSRSRQASKLSAPVQRLEAHSSSGHVAEEKQKLMREGLTEVNDRQVQSARIQDRDGSFSATSRHTSSGSCGSFAFSCVGSRWIWSAATTWQEVDGVPL